MNEGHDWLLLAPWYRWPRQQQELGVRPRATRPVLQKYEDPKFVDAFLADPQHSLAWNDDDWVYELSVLAPRLVPSGPNKDLFADQAVRRDHSRFERYLATKTSMRKVFLSTHGRFYLVVCELHCDVAGLPRAGRDDVCQAGFVVRRAYTSYPQEAEADAAAILKKIAALQLELAKLERLPAAKRALRRWESFPPPNANGPVKAKQDELRLAIKRQRKELRRWAAQHGVERAHAGWLAGERRHTGAWAVVEEEPQTLLEDSYPLYPLVPKPTDEGHSGQRSTLYFGVVPTGGSDTDVLGRPRYDDHHVYEIRSFVRRHNPHCPRTADPNDCNGELFWSRATEPFRLASHFDPVGTAHRPVNVVLPDFPSLAAQAASRPVGALSPVRMTQPARSSLQFAADVPPKDGSVGDGQICFLAIPLITIIAWFVLNLFLPVVTFLFGLWFLLRLKFCLPPSIQISKAIEVELAADGKAGVDIDVGVSASVATSIHDELLKGISASISSDAGVQSDVQNELKAYGNKPLAAYAAGSTPQKGPDFAAGIVWEQPVARADAEVLVA